MEHVYDIDTYNQPTQTIMCNFVTKHDKQPHAKGLVRTARTLRKIIVAKKAIVAKHARKGVTRTRLQVKIVRSSTLDEDQMLENQTDSSSVSFALSPPGPMPAARSFQSIHSQSSE